MHVGFYGKLPSHGDFLRRRVSDAFVDAWDGWLRECLASSRTVLGAQWLDVYLTSPAWRFVCAPGACGPAAVMGLLAPSVDQVGRYFPLTIVAELPEDVCLVTAAAGSARFLDSAEQLVIETLAADPVDFDRFDQGVAALEQDFAAAVPRPPILLDPAAVSVLEETPQAWQLPMGASFHLPSAFEQLLSLQLEAKFRPLVLWWTDGSSVVEPSWLILKGLPGPSLYPAFLEGSWNERRWRTVPVLVPEESTVPNIALPDLETPLSFRSAGATDVGRARTNNEDGFLERPEAGLWAVADGMGGHSHGEVASRMVCDALADFHVDGTFEEAVEATSRRLQEVNDHLLRQALSSHPADRSGSTVVALLLRGVRSAVLWAGDSRVYRWRGGRLEQLSQDHSLAAISGPGAAESSVITRAVGVQPDLTLDIHRDAVQADDRFLLCSDGLTRVVPEARISTFMETPDLRAAVDGLIQATLDAGAPDNVTVLIAEAYR
jgi:type VI secretion system protein ImpM